MYESIMKSATGDQNFSFSVSTVSFPTTKVLIEKEKHGHSIIFCFMVGIALSMIPCAMIAFLLKEKMESLKHMQIVSGMSLPAYWISNMMADIIKVYIADNKERLLGKPN